MLKLSFALGGHKFTADDNYINYQSAYGKSFRVLKSDIESINLDQLGFGKNTVNINGRGTTLAEVSTPKPWARKTQEFTLKEIGKIH